jgi:hypothetical protein
MAKQQQPQQAKPLAQPAAAKTTPAPAQAQTLTGGRGPMPASRTPSTATSYKLVPSEDQIRMRAYQKWQAAGCPAGDGSNFWCEAEKELREGR